jgi:hypothetical protein
LFPSQLCLQRPRPDAGGEAPLLLWRALRLWTADPWNSPAPLVRPHFAMLGSVDGWIFLWDFFTED